MCQTTSPWNIGYANLSPAGSPFAPREALEGKDARQLARELLGMSQSEFGAAFKGSPTKRGKLRGSKRNAAVVLGKVGSEADVGVLTGALDDPRSRSCASRQRGRCGGSTASGIRRRARSPTAGARPPDPHRPPHETNSTGT